MADKKIKIVKKNGKWAPVIKGLEYKAFDALTVADGCQAFVQIFNEKTVDAPAEFWAELEKSTAYGAID